MKTALECILKERFFPILPPLLALFYWLHPLASHEGWRGPVALTLLAVWSVRLSYNF